jgi:hypothetical protein
VARHRYSLGYESTQKRFEKETLCVFVLRKYLSNVLKSFEKETLNMSTRKSHHEKGVFRRQIDHKFAPTVLVGLSMIENPSSNIMKICRQKIKSFSNDQI